MSEKSIRKGRRKAETRTRSQKKSDDAQPSTTDAVGSPCEEDQTSNSPTRPKSPEANCSICLGELQNKSFTDTCFHTFCFTCLLEWSKVKPVCPLCKQTFKSIIHNVRSIQDYDQYELRHANNNAAEENSRSFQYRTTLTQDRWLSRQQRDQARQLRLLERPSTLTTRSHWQRIRQTATSDFRRRVYAEGLRVQEAEQEPGRPRRERNITPEFFQRNPACTHRLVPWLNRELNVLLHNHEDHVQFLLELIIDLIKSYEIGGEVFRTHLDSILGHRTDHFVHEFIHFARSPYDMCRYDSSAVYHVNPREVDPLSVLTVDSSSDSDDDNNEEPDIFILSPTDPSVNSRDHSYFQRGLNPEPPAERRGYFSDISAPTPNPLISQVRGFLSSVDTADTAHSGWESPIPGPSSLYWSPPQPGSPTMNDISVIDQNGTDTTPDSIQVCTDMESISEIPQQPGPSNPGDSSSEDECLVTGFEKPFEERSPMLLSSEDDLETLMAKSRGKRAKKESDRRRKKDKRRSRTPLQYRVQSKSKSKSPPPPRRRRSTSRSRQGSRSQQRSKSRDRMRRSRSRSRSRYNSNVSNQRDRRRRSKSVDRRLQRSRSRDRSDRRRRSRSRSRGSERSGASRRNNRRSKSRSPVNRRKSRSRSRGEANFRRDGRRSRSRDRHAGRKQDRRNDERDRRRPRSESIEAVVRRLNNAQRGGQDSRGNRRSRDRRSRSRDRRSRSWDRRSRSRSRTRRSRSRDRRSQARRSEARGGRSRSPGRRSQARNRRSRSKDGRSDCKKSTSGHKKSENGEVKMPEIKIKLEPASWTVASPERLGPVSKKRRATGNDTLVSVDSTSRDTSIVELHLISHSTPQSVVTDDGSNTGLSNGPTTPNTKTLNDGQSVKQSTSSAATDKVKQSTSSAATDKVKQSTSSAATDKVKQSTSSAATDKVKQSTSSAATDKVKQSTSSATTDKVKQSTSSVSSDKVKQSTSSSATDNNHCYTSRENHRSSANGEKRENLNGGGKKQSSSSSSKSRHSSDSRRSEKSATAKDKTNQSQSNAPSESSNPSQSGAAIDISLNCADRNVDLNELEKQMREKLTNRLKGGTDSHQDQSDKDVISKLF